MRDISRLSGGAAAPAIVLFFCLGQTSVVTVHHAAVRDVSPPLGSLGDRGTLAGPIDCQAGCGTSAATQATQARMPVLPIEQTAHQGTRPPGVRFEGVEGPQGASTGRNPSDNSLADWRWPVSVTAPGMAIRGYSQLPTWLRKGGAAAQLVAAALSVAYGKQDGDATIHDPVSCDWVPVRSLIARVSASLAAHSCAIRTYEKMIEKLNGNAAMVTPSNAAKCGEH